jgi:hypothetical protein
MRMLMLMLMLVLESRFICHPACRGVAQAKAGAKLKDL